MIKNKQLPNNSGAEQSVLGSIFLDPKLIISATDELSKEDFFEYAHQLIFDAMQYLYQTNKKIDFQTVIARLEDINMLEKAGGIKYITDLAESLPSSAHINSYIQIVLESSLRRETIATASKIIEDGYENATDTATYISEAEEAIFALSKKRKTSEFSKLSDIMDEVKAKIELNKNKTGGITGLATGFSNFDSLSSGLQPEELIILAARPSMGKSAYAMNLALNVAKRNKNGRASVAVFSLEMANDQLASRMLSSESQVESHKIKNGQLTDREWQFIETGKQSLSALNIYFDDSAAVTVSDIRAKCRKLSQEGQLDFVVIDYLQLIASDKKASNRQEEVAKISRSLKQMARELKIPILALSQLSRSVETREDKRPLLADLRESGSIEQDADIVLFLFRADYYKKDNTDKSGPVELIVAKNRQGASGITLNFLFDREYSRFTTLTTRSEEE